MVNAAGPGTADEMMDAFDEGGGWAGIHAVFAAAEPIESITFQIDPNDPTTQWDLLDSIRQVTPGNTPERQSSAVGKAALLLKTVIVFLVVLYSFRTGWFLATKAG